VRNSTRRPAAQKRIVVRKPANQRIVIGPLTLDRHTAPRHDSGRKPGEEGLQAMNTSRRRAIKLGICATASLATVEGLCEHVALAAGSPPQQADDGGWLRRDLFEGCRGQIFVARTRPRSIGLQLMRVDDVPGAQQAGTVGDANRFTVVFRGPRSPRLAQGTYQIASPTLGTFPLFLVPGWTYASGTVYTATFNRLP
jgi:hypothetical protein